MLDGAGNAVDAMARQMYAFATWRVRIILGCVSCGDVVQC